MEQFNSNTYKKQTPWQEFSHTCLGKIVILAAIACILLIFAALTRPSESMVRWQMEDNIKECLIANDSIKSDFIDDYVGNIGHLLTHADSTELDKEEWETYQKLNQLRIYSHLFYRTAYVINNINPAGTRIGFGIFGIVIPTVKYSDLLMNVGNVRGEYNKRLIQDVAVPDPYIGENPNVQPFHYKGNPDD